jgi:hypothetical protein
MLRLSSQSKSTPWEDVAETSATGMCTRPKLIAPFQIARAIVVISSIDVLVTCGQGQKFQSTAARSYGRIGGAVNSCYILRRRFWLTNPDPGRSVALYSFMKHGNAH